MAKLRLLAPRVRELKPRLGVPVGDVVAIDRARTDRAPWRGWYKTRRWQDLRMAVFVRDGFVCQRSGVLCIGRHPAPDSPVANHRVPHKGDPALFWDIGNIETVTKAVHDGEVQAEERAGERSR
jgi:5-methylcytosine-specific restriction protein A